MLWNRSRDLSLCHLKLSQNCPPAWLPFQLLYSSAWFIAYTLYLSSLPLGIQLMQVSKGVLNLPSSSPSPRFTLQKLFLGKDSSSVQKYQFKINHKNYQAKIHLICECWFYVKTYITIYMRAKISQRFTFAIICLVKDSPHLKTHWVTQDSPNGFVYQGKDQTLFHQ